MLNFLIGTYQLRLETADKIFLFTAAGILAAGLILAMLLYFRSFSPVNRGLLKRFKNLSLSYGLTGLVLSAFRYEGARYLEWRLWFVSITLAALAWLAKIILYWTMGYKKDLQNFRNKEIKQKYLNSRNT